ncbi:N-acetylmuramoyl-L-alanine amidase [uncultured Clostridium sp.]|uniref:N-acetylmuramoyl-L-alanine amidase n=1 Tax=uncultured Clostridium sp. TaxID=59620 RepID=UPI00273065F6|nr:N-acetylmuramoyl-L-alanine amidase [uncultured Clostridium sp.]
MSKLGINDGHTLNGVGSGAVGRIKESEHTRLVGNEVRALLKERGNIVYNCTIDYAATTNESLALVVEQANREDLDWFISIHFNAANGQGRGVEVYTYEGRQYQDALDVCNNISKVLDITNRGVKEGTGLYVVRKTKAKSMLIEVCFVDSDDADKYLKVGYKAVAKAIVDALDNHIINIPVEKPIAQKPVGDDWVRKLQEECNKQGFSNQIIDGIPGPNTLKGCPLIQRGANGNITRLLQEKLTKLGYNTNGVDGIFGNGTYNAVRQFQKNNGIGVDGIVGQNTWRKLLNL